MSCALGPSLYVHTCAIFRLFSDKDCLTGLEGIEHYGVITDIAAIFNITDTESCLFLYGTVFEQCVERS